MAMHTVCVCSIATPVIDDTLLCFKLYTDLNLDGYGDVYKRRRNSLYRTVACVVCGFVILS
jgi:hypothetical protein